MAAAVLLFGAVMLSAQNLPDVQVENMSGEQVRIRDVVAGKPAIISFWGVTCKPCITELNTLNALMDEWLEQVDFGMIPVSLPGQSPWSRDMAGSSTVCLTGTRI